jgi:polysaccharide biosynthesis protein PslG
MEVVLLERSFMRKQHKLIFFIFAAFFSLSVICVQAIPLQSEAHPPSLPIVPNGLGVNIHFFDPRPRELELLKDGGFQLIRMDLHWNLTETKRGLYDFSLYDHLLTLLEDKGIRPVFIFNYVNPLYDAGQSPYTEEGRSAFANWAVAAAKHFEGHNIVWEMYNEPNSYFWRPRPDVDAYIKLALTVGKAFRKVLPKETLIGPATLGIDISFLESCFRAGLLDYWTGVSVHPYRKEAPETVTEEFRKLRTLIKRFSPSGKQIPIISSEWGYPVSTWRETTYDKEVQGKYLTRQWLNNLANNIPISIWYGWQDNGADPHNPEDNFGVVHHNYVADRKPVMELKPAYFAAKTFVQILNGFHYKRRLSTKNSDDYILAFFNPINKATRLAVWTSSSSPHPISLPIDSDRLRVVTHTGQARVLNCSRKTRLSFVLTDAPQYLIPE